MKVIDLDADVGEMHADPDARILPPVSGVSVAGGGHADDSSVRHAPGLGFASMPTRPMVLGALHRCPPAAYRSSRGRITGGHPVIAVVTVTSMCDVAQWWLVGFDRGVGSKSRA